MNYFIYHRGQIGLVVKPFYVVGVNVKFLADDPERFFTDRGLFYQLSGGGPAPYDLLTGKIPLTMTANVRSVGNSIHLTPEGALMQLDVIVRQDEHEQAIFDIHSLPQGPKTSYVVGDSASTQDLLSGILMATTNGLREAKIEKRKFQKLMGDMDVLDNRTVHWFAVKDVLVKIQKLIPPTLPVVKK